MINKNNIFILNSYFISIGYDKDFELEKFKGRFKKF